MTEIHAKKPWSRVAAFLALEPNVVAVSTAMFLLALGENLWQKFLPKYLQALGAPIRAVGLFFVSAWSSMGSPTLFAVVGDALPKERRAMGFTVQSILRRVPIAVAPIIGGVVIAREGLVPAVRALLMVTIALSVITFVVLLRVRIDRVEGPATNVFGVWRSFPLSLRWLLVSDVFIRTCEGLVDVFLVIFATTIVGISAARYGVLVAVQMATAIAVYIPAGRIADRIGRKPFVIATFVAFALFPLAVVVARSFAGLVAAIRARTIGLYYFIRSLAIAPAAFVGG